MAEMKFENFRKVLIFLRKFVGSPVKIRHLRFRVTNRNKNFTHLNMTKIHEDKTYQVVWRTVRIYAYQISERDIIHAMEDFPGV